MRLLRNGSAASAVLLSERYAVRWYLERTAQASVAVLRQVDDSKNLALSA